MTDGSNGEPASDDVMRETIRNATDARRRRSALSLPNMVLYALLPSWLHGVRSSTTSKL